ncbi:unnamed protein product [Prunus brigantina]
MIILIINHFPTLHISFLMGRNRAAHGKNPRLNFQMILLMDNVNQSRIHMGGMLTITCKTILGIYYLMTTLHNTLTLHIEMMKIVKNLNLIETLCSTKSLMYLTMQCIKCKIL